MYNDKRLALSIFWVILGAVLLVLSVTEVLASPRYAGPDRGRRAANRAAYPIPPGPGIPGEDRHGDER